MAAQRARTEVLVENLANSETTRTPEGGPYRRKDVVFAEDNSVGSFSSESSSALGSGRPGVMVSETTVDNSEPERRYLPGHPDADKDGYVAFPKVNPAEDMVDLLGASRSDALAGNGVGQGLGDVLLRPPHPRTAADDTCAL